jgi:hypothetical protein
MANERIKKGDLVEFDDHRCRVLKRQRVSSLAMFQTSDYDVCLETLAGEFVGFVAESEVEPITDEAGRK